MRAIALVALCMVAGSASAFQNRIIGGELTTIDNYPEMVPLLFNWYNDGTYSQYCAGSILNERFILTAAHCFDHGRLLLTRWLIRCGSSFAHSGGEVHRVAQIINHPRYNIFTSDSDVSLMRAATTIVYVNNAVQAATIAGTNYNVGDNEVVWAAGWGMTETGFSSEQLRHVQIWTVNQEVCRQRYSASAITDNMLCAGWLDVGGRDQCLGDSGGPLYHGRVVVGVCSWGNRCAEAWWPGVNVRVSSFTTWIQANAV